MAWPPSSGWAAHSLPCLGQYFSPGPLARLACGLQETNGPGNQGGSCKAHDEASSPVTSCRTDVNYTLLVTSLARPALLMQDPECARPRLPHPSSIAQLQAGKRRQGTIPHPFLDHQTYLLYWLSPPPPRPIQGPPGDQSCPWARGMSVWGTS